MIHNTIIYRPLIDSLWCDYNKFIYLFSTAVFPFLIICHHSSSNSYLFVVMMKILLMCDIALFSTIFQKNTFGYM